MKKDELLLKLLLLGFEPVKPVREFTTGSYLFENLFLEFTYLPNTKSTFTKLVNFESKEVIKLSINPDNFTNIYEEILEQLGVSSEHVEGKLKT